MTLLRLLPCAQGTRGHLEERACVNSVVEPGPRSTQTPLYLQPPSASESPPEDTEERGGMSGSTTELGSLCPAGICKWARAKDRTGHPVL